MRGTRGGSVRFRDRIESPLVGKAPRVLLLGSGELGREVAIEAMRLGAEVVAADRYGNAPAMQVAHRSHVLPMTDPAALRHLVEKEAPEVIVPEIEAIATSELIRLEGDGWTVIPTSRATQATMNRERIRRIAAEEARVPTSKFGFAESPAEARKEARRIGFPCVFKAIMSSSGHGMSVVQGVQEVDGAYRTATEQGRVPNRRVMIEEFIPFDIEVTMLTMRHFDPFGRTRTTVLSPVGHRRPGTLYHESWQPHSFSTKVLRTLEKTARDVTRELGGFGVFGVECFVAGGSVYFSEVSPRPHDTGLVTLGSQWNSEFALHARSILGLPYQGPEPTTPAAAHVILSPRDGEAPSFGGLRQALGPRGVRVFLFGKPTAYKHRRLGVVVARGRTTLGARVRAERAAHAVEATIRLKRRSSSSLGSHP